MQANGRLCLLRTTDSTVFSDRLDALLEESTNNQPTPYMGAYRVELWHDVYGKVKEMDVPENTPTVTMNLEGLNSGVYVLRLIIDNQIVETSQLIVK